MAPVILRKRLIAPAVSNRNGKILLKLDTRNIKILNTLLLCQLKNTAISLKLIHFFDKIKLILIPQVRNSKTHLTLCNINMKIYKQQHSKIPIRTLRPTNQFITYLSKWTIHSKLFLYLFFVWKIIFWFWVFTNAFKYLVFSIQKLTKENLFGLSPTRLHTLNHC